MRPLRIAYVCADPGVPFFGCKGASVHAQEVLRAWRRQGAEIELFTPRADGDAAPDLRALPLSRLPAPPKGTRAEQEQAELAANDALRTALAARGPFDLIYERYSLWSHAGMTYSREQGVPGILEVNAPLIDEQATHRGLLDRPGAESVAGRAFNAARVIACVSGGVADWVRQRTPDARIEVVPNGVDARRFGPHVAPLQPPADDAFVIGFVGTLKPWHGIPTLAEAFRQLHARQPRARLLIVGDGPERSALDRILDTPALRGALHCTGAVDPATIPGWLASMHVAVAPYPALDHFYFSPLKIFEYLAAGRAIVASRIGQVTEILRDGETGCLVPPGDVPALVGALERLREDPAGRARLGAAGRAQVQVDHSWDAIVARLRQLAVN